jgi:hypothetical protein
MERLPGHGLPSRLSTIRSSACASVAVPTVDRALAPIRSWSTMVARTQPVEQVDGRARFGMKSWTNVL